MRGNMRENEFEKEALNDVEKDDDDGLDMEGVTRRRTRTRNNSRTTRNMLAWARGGAEDNEEETLQEEELGRRKRGGA